MCVSVCLSVKVEISVTALTILMKLSEKEENIILRILTEPFFRIFFLGAPGVKTGINFKQNGHCPISSYIFSSVLLREG